MALRATGLFTSVIATTSAQVAPGTDWEIREPDEWRWDPGGRGCPDGMWMATFLSLGAIPIVRSEDVRYAFEVIRRGERASVRRVEIGGEVSGVSGWLAMPLLLLPWWWTSPESGWRADREAELLAVQLVNSGILDEPQPAR